MSPAATKAERETIINFLESDNEASVFTCNRKFQNRLAGYGIEPTETDAATNGKMYTIPRNYVRIQRPASETREWTDEQKDAARERLAGVRAVRAAERAKAAKAAGTAAKPVAKAAAAAAPVATKQMTAKERLQAKSAAKAAPAVEQVEEDVEEVEVVTPKAKSKK